MGGKGKKRREKNYRAAHGGTTRLPPPPNTSSIDAIPSKLRQIMAFSDRKKGDSGGSANGKVKLHIESWDLVVLILALCM
ncbi:hypothetical protein KY285_024108 [Solanum tuberosum]|nr:hypothetical protein KY289_024452 [Solanum tuberosum]KAH0676307.1 hypothetical protein KY285_024108 [Solanum tuberosum]